jgi:hypothetical protein
VLALLPTRVAPTPPFAFQIALPYQNTYVVVQHGLGSAVQQSPETPFVPPTRSLELIKSMACEVRDPVGSTAAAVAPPD